ncbi:Proteasome subunit alpha type [Paramicrosporidium saccamoebae]|uniref:Proteasome subunit alpha type n=1 Tax=Paramicrosporidium saccamoebae TaxID=1246581 RepID=A0A2H9TIR1_9FUNG|nr:Proteasome subunit alpha type [Paramicrosporidium saccamoebae]
MSGYNYSLTTFSPSGKLPQIEYALTAVEQGTTSIGVRGATSSVVVTERKATPLTDGTTMERMSTVCDNIGLVYSGMGPDARVLTTRARKAAQAYIRTYGENPPVYMLVRELASVMQEYTQSGGVRPFGVSLLVAGVDSTGASLYQVDPSGTSWAWKAAAVGKGMAGARSFLEKRWNEGLEVEDAVHTALLTMKEGFEGTMTKDNIEIGIADEKTGGFTVLTLDEIQDYLSNL